MIVSYDLLKMRLLWKISRISCFQMCSNSWPLLLDLSRDECKRILRRLELDAYSSIVSAFRAQGDLTKEKKKLLNDLQGSLR